MVDVNAVEAKIIDEEEAILGRDGDAMSMRRCLTGTIRAVAAILEVRYGVADPAVGCGEE